MRTKHLSITTIVTVIVLMSMMAIPNMANLSSNNNIVQMNTPNDQGLIDVIISKDGVWSPSNEYNRWRRDEFSTGDFFQWWYYAVKSPTTNEFFAVWYYFSFCETNPALSGVNILFSYVSPSEGKFQLSYVLPLSEYVFVGNNNELIIDDGKYLHTPLSDDQYYITGIMDTPSDLWTYTSDFSEWTGSTEVSWNVTLTRIAGCVTQNDFMNIQDLQHDLGLAVEDSTIMWDTHMFDALVSGVITIGNNVWNLSDPKIRGYGDMDYGQRFMSESDDPTNPQKYYWGWLSTNKVNVANPSADTSIIVGVGKDADVMGIEWGAEFIVAAASNVNNKDIAWKFAEINPDGAGVSFLEECSDGSSLDSFITVKYELINWFSFTDQYGTSLIPSHQKITLESEFTKIVIDAYVNATCTSRLLCLNPNGVFSNFESLGAVMKTNIYNKTYKWYDVIHCNPAYTLTSSFTDVTGGLEFGYATQCNVGLP